MPEVSLTTFPDRRQTWPLTTDGGRILSWSADRLEILVATPSGHIVAYPANSRDGTFSAGPPRVLDPQLGFDADSRATLITRSFWSAYRKMPTRTGARSAPLWLVARPEVT